MSSLDAKNPSHPHIFAKIKNWYVKRKWTISRIVFVIGALIFWAWIYLGAKMPHAKEIFLIVGPVLFMFFANLLISISAGIEELADEEHFRSAEAYTRALNRLKRVRIRKITPWKPINIDMIGVTFKHSSSWIENDLIPFMKEKPDYYFELRMVFVDDDYLKELSLSDNDRVKQSTRRVKWVKKVLIPAIDDLGGRLRVHVRTIQNIPHWHGILIERRYLYLGRVSWESDDSERGLTEPTNVVCAENGYREFSKDDRRGGDDRVDLFRRWMAHYLYGGHKGRHIHDDNTPFYTTMPKIDRPL